MLELSTPQRHLAAPRHALSVGLVRLFTPPPPPSKKRCVVEFVVAVSDSDSEANNCTQEAHTGAVTTGDARGDQSAVSGATCAVATAVATATDACYHAGLSEAFSELGDAENPCNEEVDEVVISDDDSALAVLPQERKAEDALQTTLHAVQGRCMVENGPSDELPLAEDSTFDVENGPSDELPPAEDSTFDDQPTTGLDAADDLFAEFSFHGPMPFRDADTKQYGVCLPRRGRRCQQPAAAVAAAAAAGTMTIPKRPQAKVGATNLNSTMPAEDRLRILEKWQDLAGPAPHPEALRFQLLVAAILHPKASEAAVRGCMLRLHDWAGNDAGSTHDRAAACGLTPARLASAAVEEVECKLEGLHWHRTKAARIVAAAKAIDAASREGHGVPRRREQLLTVPGVGPKLAELLEFVSGELTADETEHCDADLPHCAAGGAMQGD